MGRINDHKKTRIIAVTKLAQMYGVTSMTMYRWIKEKHTDFKSAQSLVEFIQYIERHKHDLQKV